MYGCTLVLCFWKGKDVSVTSGSVLGSSLSAVGEALQLAAMSEVVPARAPISAVAPLPSGPLLQWSLVLSQGKLPLAE